MRLTFDIDLSPEREKWATTALQRDVEAKESTASTVEEYLGPKLQPFLEQKLSEMTDSWKPEESVEIKERRAAAAALLKEVPIAKLEAIEATLAAEFAPNP